MNIDARNGRRGYPNGHSAGTATRPLAAPKPTDWHALLAMLGQWKWLFGALGTFCVIIHFWRAGFLPQLSVIDLGLVAGAIVCFAALIFIYFSLVLLAPGLALANLIDEPQHAPASFGTIARYAFLGWIISATAYYIMAKALSGMALQISLLVYVGTAGLLFLVLMMADEWPWWIRRWRTNGARSRIELALYIGALYAITIPISAVILGATAPETLSQSEDSPIVFLGILIVAHFAVVITHRLTVALRLGLLMGMTLLVTVTTGVGFEWIDRATSNFRIGMMANQTVLVTEKGCHIAKAAGVATGCNPIYSPTSTPSLYEIKPVMILTRLGSYVVIGEKGWRFSRKTSRSVPLPAADVISWYKYEESHQEPTAESASSVQPPTRATIAAAPPVRAKPSRKPPQAKHRAAVTCLPDEATPTAPPHDTGAAAPTTNVYTPPPPASSSLEAQPQESPT
ncbi:hypothetical protein [Stenotrophomonas rhizophila]|uniref:hypothetical protein n=1 Tax=Stenotrophomonas rhizophila TaxID=216778 RepID=UPI00163B1A7F|nr:hypothetical protein [Stenotrophomonas rhizophila]